MNSVVCCGLVHFELSSRKEHFRHQSDQNLSIFIICCQNRLQIVCFRLQYQIWQKE